MNHKEIVLRFCIYREFAVEEQIWLKNPKNKILNRNNKVFTWSVVSFQRGAVSEEEVFGGKNEF